MSYIKITWQYTRSPWCASSLISLCIAVRGSGPPGSSKDEPEAAVLLVACAIGLVTGGGVVLFNNAIHSIRHLAFQVSTV